MLAVLIVSFGSLSLLAAGWHREVKRRNDLIDAIVLERAKLSAVQDYLRRKRIAPPVIVRAELVKGGTEVGVVCGCKTCLRAWGKRWAAKALAEARGS